MVYDIYPPTKELEDIVKHFVVIESLNSVEDFLFLPNAGNFIMFNRGFDGYVKTFNSDKTLRIPKKYSISCNKNKVRHIIIDTDNEKINFPIIFVELLPLGFYKLFDTDADYLNGRFLEIDEQTTQRYFSKLYTHTSIEEELNYLQSSLLSMYNSHKEQNIKIEDILDAIENNYDYEVNVEQLLKEYGISRSTLERYFKKYVGLTPKKFIYVLKFYKTVKSFIEDKCTFSKLKYIYSDNSHLNVVFKKFLGMNPSVFLKEVEDDNLKIYQVQDLSKKKN